MAIRTQNFRLRRTQYPFFMKNNSFFDEDEKVSMMIHCVHRRGGKSVGAAFQDARDTQRLLNEMEVYKLRGDVDSTFPVIGYVAPTKLQARQIIWDNYKNFFEGFEGVRFNNTQLSITIPRPVIGDHITVQLFASKNHDRIRGLKLVKANVDEIQDSHPDAVSKSIMPTLKDSRGLMNAFGTAKGEDMLHTMIVKAIETGKPCFLMPIDQTGVFTDKEIEAIRAECVDGAFEREYMLDFTAKLPGTFFHSKIEEMKREPWFYMSEYQPELTNVMGVDIGVGEGFAAWTAQTDNYNNVINIQDFYTGYDNLMDLRKDMAEDDFLPDVIFLPHDGKTRSLGAHKADTPKQRFREIFPESLIKPQKRTQELMTDIARINENLHLLRFPDIDASTDAHRGLRYMGEFCRKKDPSTGANMDAIDKSRGVDHAADAMRTLFNGLNVADGRIKRPYEYKRHHGTAKYQNSRLYTPHFSKRFSNDMNLLGRMGRNPL